MVFAGTRYMGIRVSFFFGIRYSFPMREEQNSLNKFTFFRIIIQVMKKEKQNG